MNQTRLKRHLLAIAILLFLSMLWAYKSSTLGTQNDEGVHVTAANLIANGRHIYRDFYENRTPGVEWLLAAFFSLTKSDVRLARLLTNNITMLTLASLIAIARLVSQELRDKHALPKRSSWASAYITCGLFGLTPLVIFWSRFTMLEFWQTAVGALAMLLVFFATQTGQPRYWFASGALAAIALVFKQSALTIVAAMGIIFLLRAITRTRSNVMREGLYWFLGFTAPLILFLIVLTLRGSLPNFLLFVSGLERLAPFEDLPSKIASWAAWAVRQPLVPLAIAGLLMLRLRNTDKLMLVVIWSVIEQIALFAAPEMDLGWGGFSHYVIPSTATLAILGGVGYLWIQARISSSRRPLVASLLVLPIIITIPGWIVDLKFSARDMSYPMNDMEAEKTIGQAISATTPEDRSVLVLANSVFYHHSGRNPNNIFFHYPEYLPTSSINNLATNDIQSVLQGEKLGSLVVSRMHLDSRLPTEIKSRLWENWTPIARFPYSYQGDIFIFLPKITPTNSDRPLARFDGEIALLDASTQFYGQDALLVRLFWQAGQNLGDELSVFTHLVNGNGDLVAQNDSVPAVGFRPLASWQIGQYIEDVHWITYDRSLITQGYAVLVGLYNAATGKRLPLLPTSHEQSYYMLDFDLE